MYMYVETFARRNIFTIASPLNEDMVTFIALAKIYNFSAIQSSYVHVFQYCDVLYFLAAIW